MTAIQIAGLINAAFSILHGLRQFGITSESINTRFARIDAGGEAITVAEVEGALDTMQKAIDEGRNLP